jgi:hypothetical protein
MQPGLDVRQVASDLANLILTHERDERLAWQPDRSVLIRARLVLPRVAPAESASKQTVDGRRRRFWQALDEMLTSAEWRLVGPRTYAPPWPTRPRTSRKQCHLTSTGPNSKTADVKVRTYGNAAVVTGQVILTGSATAYRSGPRRFTEIWVEHDGRWQNIGGQTTLVPEKYDSRVAWTPD